MFDEIELVDPDEDKCDECKCSFGIHLVACSKFYKCSACGSHNPSVHYKNKHEEPK